MTDTIPPFAPGDAPPGDAPEAPGSAAEALTGGVGDGHNAASFDSLPLSRELRETLAEMGYLHPTPVQLAVWEPATRGRDAVVQARTGTGKTAAFGLPIVDHVVKRSQAHVQVLVLTPTRELAVQVTAELERLAKRRAVKVLAIYGGAPMPRQVEQIAAGAQVVVGTPGRVLDHLRRGTLVPKHVRMLVLDESDEMLSMGFERELSAILETLPPERQTLLFSATLPPDIERMAKNKLHSPEFITLSGDHIGALEIEHFVYMVASDKPGALLRVLEVENPESAVVFCNTKDETERVAGVLSRQGFDADWLNGDLPQNEREQVMTATREGKLRFLVATDVAARGIDISHLTHVINYDFPQDAEGYVHRTGRTGRAGRTGTAVSLITPRDVGGLYILRLTYKIRPIEKQIPSEGEVKTRAEADLVAMLAEAFLGKGAVHPDDISLARRLLTHDQIDVILAGLLRDHLGARPTAKDESAAARRATRRPDLRPRQARARAETPAPAGAVAPATAPTGAFAARPHVAPAAVAQAAGATPGAAMKAVAAPAAAPGVVAGVAPGAAAGPRAAPVFAPGAAPVHPAAPMAPEAPAGVRAASPEAGGPRASLPHQDDRERRGDRRFPGPRRDGPRARPEGAPTGPRPGDRGGPQGGRRREGPADDPVTGDMPLPPPPLVQGAPPERHSRKHSDLRTWQPPEEAGDDEPILRDDGVAGGPRPRAPGEPPHDAGGARPRAPSEVHGAGEVDAAEIYVNVGRREGARAADLQRVLLERGIDRADVLRIRVRDRNAFVGIRRESLAKAIAALTGATIAGKVASAEQARGRTDDAGSDLEPPTPRTAPAETPREGPRHGVVSEAGTEQILGEASSHEPKPSA